MLIAMAITLQTMKNRELNTVMTDHDNDEDWQVSKTLPECMMFMLEHEIMCDVIFKVGTGQTVIKAHKYILASRSPVFYMMFEGSIPETGEVTVPDIDDNTFKALLKYLYTDDLDLTTDNVKQMLYTAEKYMMLEIKKACLELLKTMVQSADTALVFQPANDFNLMKLKSESFRYIEKNTTECLQSPYALELSKGCVKAVLESDYLSCSETDVLKFLVAWSENLCRNHEEEVNGKNMRKFAEDLLQSIRFPLVDKGYFSDEIATSGFLTQTEALNVFKSFYGKKSTMLQKERVPVHHRKTKIISRYHRISTGWDQRGLEGLMFRTNKNIFLKGVIIFGPQRYFDLCHGDFLTFHSDIPIAVNICCDDESLISESRIQSIDSCSTFNYLFSEAVQVEADKKYHITLSGLSFDSNYGIGCKQTCVADDIAIEFFSSCFCTTKTTVESGQIAGFLYSV